MGADSMRALMRRVALGLPLVVGPLVLQGCFCGCGDPQRETVPVSDQVQPDAGTAEAGVADAGARFCAPCLLYYEGKYLVDCTTGADGRATECTYEYECLGGRRPDAAVAARVSPKETARERWLMELATMEAGSVPAFRSLARALAHHGAPAELVARAEASADDEVRHARLALHLAGHGAIEVSVRDEGVPSLEALAVHNAGEGCVREAYGALEAAYQSEHADDAETREAFGQIARDEARHALLSFDIDAWARRRVDGAILDAARATARRQLDGMLATRAVPEGLGLPAPDAARTLLRAVA